MGLLAAAAVSLAVLLAGPMHSHARAASITGHRLAVQRAARERAERLATFLRARSSRSGARRRAAMLDVLGALAAELHAGLPPRVALVRALSEQPLLCPRTLAAASFGGNVVEAIHADAHGLPALRSLAAAWQVGENAGAGLAASVTTLLNSARENEEVRRQLDAQLAAPRATARMLTTLPLIGIAMGLMLGGDPLGWLLGTSPGRICLFAGVGLTALGALWTNRIALHAQSRA